MPRPVGESRAEPVVRQRSLIADPPLEPHLIAPAAVPQGEGTDAVGTRQDGVQLLDERVARHVVVDVLRDVVRRDEVEGQAAHDAERTETDDDGREVGRAPVDRHEVPVGR
jgi:hypothetical protein